MTGNYLPLLAQIAAVARPGEAQHITVLHDDWCALLASGGPCNCEPEIMLGKPGESARA